MPISNAHLVRGRCPAVSLLSLLLLVSSGAGSVSVSGAAVRVWEEHLELPSYRLGPPDPCPIFYEGESYQGAQKRVYPYPLQDALTNERTNETFRAVYLENEHIKLCVLPDIGGRLFYATDKSNGYDFFYRQSVIKPALIGMLGAWISGGIEWCVFHHHRNTTHMPVDYGTRENPDGSQTLWIGEIERRHRMRWLIGMTLHPGKSYIEVEVRMINRTPMPHSILYWANVAVHVNNGYQVIFPPSVQVATYHAKNDFVHWPIGQGRYRGSDYSGVDLSWWQNHPKAVSCFAWDLREDFMGGYDHQQDAGVVHVGDHHVVCGAKLWEWAPGNIWDTQVLTDSDGPYAELMVGAFSDNQPDYSWIKPLEVKRFKQYWYPVKQIGGFKCANLDAAVNLEFRDGHARVGVHTTSKRDKLRVLLEHAGHTLLDQRVDLDPATPFTAMVPVPATVDPTACRLSISDEHGHPLITYRPESFPPLKNLPERVAPPPPPESIVSPEELYFTGLRAEQIHQPRVDATDYYREALKRDPHDVRCNVQMGIHLNRGGLHAEAETHLRRAIARMTADYTRAKDTEAYYQLGLSLKAQGRAQEAVDAFQRAAWDSACFATAQYQLATLAVRQGDFEPAREHIDEALSMNARNPRVRNLRVAILRHLGRSEEALSLAADLAREDPLDRWSRNERRRLGGGSGLRPGAGGGDVHHFEPSGDLEPWLELATDYIDAGLLEDAVELLERLNHDPAFEGAQSPLVAYYLGYLRSLHGEPGEAETWFTEAERRDPARCFPFRTETLTMLEKVIAVRPRSARAHYYLGNALYESQPIRAVQHWETARELEPGLAMVHRNLGWAYFRREQAADKAIASYEKAIDRDPGVGRFYLELDALYERANTEPISRLAMLDRSASPVRQRKDLLIRRITLLVATGDYAQALELLSNHQFFVSEGGGDELGNAYVDACLLEGLRLLDQGSARQALEQFHAAAAYPENLSQESPRNERRMGQIDYCRALAEAELGEVETATKRLRDVVDGQGASRPENRFYRAMALRLLGRENHAAEQAAALVESATKAMNDAGQADVFAKFGEQRTRQFGLAESHYQLGLGHLAAEDHAQAARHFREALNLNRAHVWARHYLDAVSGR
jgi:tetratricopeptide (TPR) repeat protein